MKITEPKLILTFQADDLEPGHSSVQELGACDIIRDSLQFKEQRFSGLMSSSDQVSLQLRRRCPSTEDIIATEGNIAAVLQDGETDLFTGFVSTSFSWGVTDHGEDVLGITLESVGTRLLNRPFIESGRHYLSGPASAAVYTIVHPLGITIRQGDDRKLLQPVSREVEAGTTCRDLLDRLFYECNAVYWFNSHGELCVEVIDPDPADAPVFNHSNLVVYEGRAVKVTKQLRTYKGARVAYDELDEADDYLIYRNTTNQSEDHPYCDLPLQGGEYFDGAEIFTDQEWSEATEDEFREPTLIGAVNADSESSKVGSNRIVSISGLSQAVEKDAAITFSAEIVGGPYFKLLAHNTSGSEARITRMDLYASIVYVKSHGVIRTQIEGPDAGKGMLEESLEWIHDRDNASRHANLLAQYHRCASSSYTFYSREPVLPGTVIRLHDDVFSGLDVHVMVVGRQYSDRNGIYTYNAVGITAFDLTKDAYHGTTEQAHQSGKQGPQGAPGETAEIQYALGSSIITPPSEVMLWQGQPMLWDGQPMLWNDGLYTDEVPELERGKYIWMRSRIGDGPWQYLRLTGTVAWDPENLGIAMTETPKQSKQGLGLIPGDYFVAGAAFTEDGVPYYAGYAYTYNGTAWVGLDLIDEENARKASDLMDSLVSAGIQIPSSSSAYSVWLWAKNFVSQSAVIDNLFSQAITILSGGYIKGGTRYNNSGGVANWNAKGFWFSADGTLKASLQSDDSGNTFVGTGVSQASAAVGSYNTALGYQAMYSDSGSQFNVAVGYRTLYSVTPNGQNNVAIGYQALLSNTSGDDNVAIGSDALRSNTTEGRQVAIGRQSLTSCSSGYENVGVGSDTLRSLTSGTANVAVGYAVLYRNNGTGNTVLGYGGMGATSSASYNTAVGYLAMYSATGNYNVAIGYLAFNEMRSGSNNIGIGTNVSAYSASGSRQININNALIGLEFKAGRSYAQVYAALATYLTNTANKVTCIGVVEGDYASRIEVVDSTTIRVYGAQYHNFNSISSSTLSKRMVLFFVNPKLNSDTSDDCLA